MLEAIRKNVTGILAKLLIALLVVSFAVWGIGDMVRGYGRDAVANVGGTPIRTSDFRQAYQSQLDLVARQFRRRLTPQQAKTLGVEAQVLSRLTGAAAVDNHGRELKLDLGDKEIEKSVYTDPLFAGIDGKFSPDRLRDVLSHSGYSEQRFLESRKLDTLRSQLTDSMLANVAPPKALTEMLTTYQGELRTAKYFEVTPAKAVKLGAPSEDDLKKTYENNKNRFIIPEYRKFNALLLTSAAAKAKIEITEAELKTKYEEDKSLFATPERRRIEQIPFKDEAAATAAKDKLTKGAKFLEIAKAAGAKEADIKLGFLTRDGLIDPKIAEAAFKLAKGKTSDVVKGRFKTVILRVTEIEEKKQQPFEAVKADIRNQIETQRAADKVQELQNNIDDNRLAGKSLKEISEILKLPYLDIAAADKDGKDPTGKDALKSADKTQLLRTAFAAEIGVENEVIQLANEGLAWLSLVAVTPQKQKPREDVSADIKKVWTELETRRQLIKISANMAKRINDGEKIEEVAKEITAKVKTTPAIKRGDSVPDFPAAAIGRAFNLKNDRAAEAAGNGTDTRLVMQVVKIEPPKKLTDAAQKSLQEQLSRQLQSDIVAQYVSDLQKRMGVTINSAMVDLTTGTSTEVPYQN